MTAYLRMGSWLIVGLASAYATNDSRTLLCEGADPAGVTLHVTSPPHEVAGGTSVQTGLLRERGPATWGTMEERRGVARSGADAQNFAREKDAAEVMSGGSVSAGVAHPDVAEAILRTGGNFFTIPPCRLLDTRATGQPLSSTPITLQVSGNCGVPAFAAAITGNLTVVTPPGGGWLRLAPTGLDGLVSSLNYGLNTRANNFTIGLSPGGQANLFATNTTHGIVDITGYYTTETAFPDSTCITNGHFTTSTDPYPFTEDITDGSASSIPFRNPVTVYYNPALTWTTIQGGCQRIAWQNIQGPLTGEINLMLRAMTRLAYDPLTPAGALYEVQLRIDGQEYGWFVRRARVLPQNDYFEGTAQGIAAGNHRYTMAVRLLDPGQITFDQQWITATGAPVAYPSRKGVASSSRNLSTTLQPLDGTAITVDNQTGADIDLFLNGYVQVDQGTPGELLSFGVQLDGAAPQRTSSAAVPPQLYAGINLVDHLFGVKPGTHTVQLEAQAASSDVYVSWRSLEYASFPSSSPAYKAQANDTVIVDTYRADPNNPGRQPAAANLSPSCGFWTPLLDIPVNIGNGFTFAASGYVQVTSPIVSPDNSQFAIEVPPYEAGIIAVHITPTPDGFYFFSDGSTNVGCASCTVTLWARKINGCGQGGPGKFSVANRYLALKWVPNGGAYY